MKFEILSNHQSGRSNLEVDRIHSSTSGTEYANSCVMAVCTDSSRCGCAIYSDAVVQLVADRKDPGDPYKGLDLLIQRVEPKVVIISSVQKRLITFLETRFSGDDQPKLEIVPNSWFAMSRGIQKLVTSEFVSVKKLKTIEAKLLYINTRIDKSSDVCAIRAIAAIDSYLVNEATKKPDADATQSVTDTQSTFTRRLGLTQSSVASQSDVNGFAPKIVNDRPDLMPILNVGYIEAGPVLSIDKLSLQSLGIFSKGKNLEFDPDHPDLLPSLHEMLDQCSSRQGKRQLKTMMLWPLQDVEEIRKRHDTIDYFIDPKNRLFRDQLSAQLKNMVPLGSLMGRLSQSICPYGDLYIIYKCLWTFIAIIDLIKQNEPINISILDRIVENDSNEFRLTIEAIVNVVDFESSKREKRLNLNLGIDDGVDEKKEVACNLAKFCDQVAVEETDKYRNLLGRTVKVLYIPRIGFLESVDYRTATELIQMRNNREFDILMHTDQFVYYKTKRMEELDNNAGDITCDLIDAQEKVLLKLQQDLLQFNEPILHLMELCGELDCLIAFSLVASMRGHIRPEFLSSSETIELRQAYHPLQSVKTNVVPNDIHFLKESSQRKAKIMVLTGPNSCGKSTYMTTACLVVYMAHIGCFVPAMEARIPLVDAILTRIHSANSVSTGLSSFASDLHQVNYAINRATERSLVAVDEFGEGTQACDGFLLLKGLLTYFASRGQKSPFVMVATHFNRIPNQLLSYHDYILYKTFKIFRDLARDTIIYEFQVTDGIGEQSLADQVAMKAGVPESIIERAKQIREIITTGRIIGPRPPRGA